MADITHLTLAITLPKDDRFMIDICGAQHGWDEVLLPLDVYCKHRVGRFHFFTRLQEDQVARYNDLLSLPRPHTSLDGMKNLGDDVVAKLAEGCKAHLHSVQMTMAQLLNLPSSSFATHRSSFVTRAKTVISREMDDLASKGLDRLYPIAGKVDSVLTDDTRRKCEKLWVSDDDWYRIRRNPKRMAKLDKKWELMNSEQDAV